ncbi:MAG TPA: DNA-binding protein [Treponema sp.]|nr:DNA-binding protein [Treponema sp.]
MKLETELMQSDSDIRSEIYVVRGVQVMLDKDLAGLYGVETKVLNQAVKRNMDRFPEQFCFQLTVSEYSILRSQIVTSSSDTESLRSQNATLSLKEYGGRRYLPYVFTEQGVAMLSAVLRSATAVQVSIRIMAAFVEMLHFLSANASLYERVNVIEHKQLAYDEYKIEADKKFDKVFEALEAADLPKQGIFCDGQIYDAYEFASGLVRTAKKSLILIDNYIDDTVLTMMDKRRSGVNAAVYTKTISKQLALDVQKHNAQYPAVEIRIAAAFHYRFLIMDEKELYHIGASLKDLGKKVFAFSRLELPVAETMKTLGVAV